MVGWSTDRVEDEEGGTRHSERHYSCAGLLLRVMDVRLSVLLRLSVFTHLTLRDSSCIFITRPDLIFETLVRYWLRYSCHTNSWQWRTGGSVRDWKHREEKHPGISYRIRAKNTQRADPLKYCIPITCNCAYFILLQSLHVCQDRFECSASLQCT